MTGLHHVGWQAKDTGTLHNDVTHNLGCEEDECWPVYRNTDDEPPQMPVEHTYDGDGRCTCGAIVVWWETEGTHGCEVGGPWWATADDDPHGELQGRLSPVDGIGRPYVECPRCGAQASGRACRTCRRPTGARSAMLWAARND